MKYTLYPIQQIPPELLPIVAKLHETSLRILLSDMGYPFVLRYFEIAAKDPSVIGFYAMSDSNELIGYVVGAPKPNEINSQLTRPILWFVGQCFRLLFTRPRVLIQAIISSLTLSRQLASEQDAFEVVYMSVDVKARGLGLGRTLMTAIHDGARAAGYKRAMVSEELGNEVIKKLLDSLGYKLKYTFREGRYHRQRIELLL